MIKKHNKKGFSLIELIVSVSILLVLMSILIPSFVYYKNKSRTTQDNIKLNSVCVAFKTALGEPEVRDEIDKISGGDNVIVVCKIDEKGMIKFNEGDVIGTSNTKLKDTKLWLNSFQLIGMTYKVEYKNHANKYLVFSITPKTSTTTAECGYYISQNHP